MSHPENRTVSFSEGGPVNIEVDLVYPYVIRDSKIFYIRRDAEGKKVRIPLKAGTTQNGVVWTRRMIIRYALAYRVADILGHDEYRKTKGSIVFNIIENWVG